MPKVLYSRGADGSIPLDCYIMDKIDGGTLFMSFGKLLYPKSAKLAFADKVTDALHGIHECRCDKFGDTMNPQFSSWLECYEPFMNEVYSAAKQLSEDGQLSYEIVSTMSRARDKFSDIFSQPVYDACLIHGDLNVGNIMVGKGLRITGFIDPLNSMYADREYDLFQFNNLTGKRFFLCDTYLKNTARAKSGAEARILCPVERSLLLCKGGHAHSIHHEPAGQKYERRARQGSIIMASVPARITSALLSAVFHSRFIKNENMSSNAGAAAKIKAADISLRKAIP